MLELQQEAADARTIVSVWWPKDKAFYAGVLVDFNPLKHLHYLRYMDGQREWLDLRLNRFVVLTNQVRLACLRAMHARTRRTALPARPLPGAAGQRRHRGCLTLPAMHRHRIDAHTHHLRIIRITCASYACRAPYMQMLMAKIKGWPAWPSLLVKLGTAWPVWRAAAPPRLLRPLRCVRGRRMHIGAWCWVGSGDADGWCRRVWRCDASWQAAGPEGQGAAQAAGHVLRGAHVPARTSQGLPGDHT